MKRNCTGVICPGSSGSRLARIGIGSEGCHFVFGRTTPIGSSATRPSDVSKRTLTAIVESESRPPLERAKKRSVGRSRPTQIVLVSAEPLAPETPIRLTIRRAGAAVFQGETALERMRRERRELVSWLFRETTFPAGVYLLTGTGVVPPEDFTLQSGDEVRIEIPPIGELVNAVE